MQESLAKQLRDSVKFSKDMGKIHNAMEKQLQKLNVKRQAYHSNSFVGNHVSTCLEVSQLLNFTTFILELILILLCPFFS